MSSSFIASGVGRRTGLALAAVLTVALTISLVNVAESSAFEARAVAAKKKCKKGKKSAVAAKKKCKKKKKAPVVVPPPAPLPLTDGEVINQIGQRAGVYCAQDLDCTGVFGYYFDGDPGRAACSSRSTYSWACFGFWDGDDGTDTYTCDFREIVERDGFNGIKSHLDTSFSGDGFSCFLTSP